MANLDSLNKTIEDLEVNSKQIKNISETFTELKKLYLQTKNINEGQEELNRKTQKVKDFFSEAMDDTFQRLQEERNDQKQFNEDIINLMKQQSNKYNQSFEELLSKFNELNKIQQELNGELINNIKAVSTENTKLYMDQKKHIENQLDLNFGEAQNHSMKTKKELLDIIHYLDEKVIAIEKSTEEALEGNKKAFRVNKFLLLGVLGVGVANILVAIFI